MTAQPPLPITPEAPAILLGEAAALIEDEHGGRVFLHGNLVYAWAPGQDAVRRWSAVQLARLRAAPRGQIAAAFGVDPGTLWRWDQTLSEHGAAGLASDKRGPKGPHRLTAPVIARIHALAAHGKTQTAIARAAGVSTTSVRRALGMPVPELAAAAGDVPGSGTVADADADADAGAGVAGTPAAEAAPGDQREGARAVGDVPVLPEPVDRCGERALARFGLIEHAPPVFAPAGRVPLAGLLLALPGLEATGLLGCAKRVFGALPNGFYGLESVLLEAVLRTLAGQARAEGATRIDPAAFGRVLGLDRSPEVKTIRRRLGQLAGTGKADRLIAAMAATHLARPQAIATGSGDPQDCDAVPVGMLLYVDGHVRAYQGTRKIGKTHLARLRFPAPATLETWVADADGDPVLVVMAQPGASLAGELRRLVPELRAAVGDERRVLVGFDRGGWSPALFKHLHATGFDVLTWRKGPAEDIAAAAFTDLDFTDETGREHTWRVADTMVTLALPQPKNTSTDPTRPADGGDPSPDDALVGVNTGPDGEPVFAMRQITLAVPATTHAKRHAANATTEDGASDDGAGESHQQARRQIHILTTRTDLPAAEVIYRMGSRWRQENYFRYARMHFELDGHDCYAAGDDDPDRPVPNPAKKHAYQQVIAARARHEREAAAADAALLQARSPQPGTPVIITNEHHDALTAALRTAEAALTAAEAAHAAIPTRLPLRQVNPGQQVLETQTKLLTHAIRMAAFNTASTLARELRLHTGYARKNDEAHTLIRQALTWTGDLDPTTPGVLTIRLDPLPTARASTALAELCAHLTSTKTHYPGTDLTLRYEMKPAT